MLNASVNKHTAQVVQAYMLVYIQTRQYTVLPDQQATSSTSSLQELQTASIPD